MLYIDVTLITIEVIINNMDPLKDDKAPAVTPGATDVPAIDPQTTEPKPVDIEAIKTELKAEIEATYKTQISGLDKTVTKLLKEKEELELSKLDEAARKAKEIEIAKEELKAVTAEAEAVKRERLIDKNLDSAGLPLDFAKRITGNTEDEIIEDVKAFKIFLDAKIKEIAEKEVNDRFKGKPPEGGDPPAEGSIDEKIKAAQTANNWPLVMDLRAQKDNAAAAK